MLKPNRCCGGTAEEGFQNLLKFQRQENISVHFSGTPSRTACSNAFTSGSFFQGFHNLMVKTTGGNKLGWSRQRSSIGSQPRNLASFQSCCYQWICWGACNPSYSFQKLYFARQKLVDQIHITPNLKFPVQSGEGDIWQDLYLSFRFGEQLMKEKNHLSKCFSVAPAWNGILQKISPGNEFDHFKLIQFCIQHQMSFKRHLL